MADKGRAKHCFATAGAVCGLAAVAAVVAPQSGQSMSSLHFLRGNLGLQVASRNALKKEVRPQDQKDAIVKVSLNFDLPALHLPSLPPKNVLERRAEPNLPLRGTITRELALQSTNRIKLFSHHFQSLRAVPHQGVNPKPRGAGPIDRSVFGHRALEARGLPLFANVKGVFPAPSTPGNLEERKQKKSCSVMGTEGRNACGFNSISPWRSVIKKARSKFGEEKLRYINQKVNENIAYQDDIVDGLLTDEWNTAEVTMRRGRGDCEDYAILKMWLLEKAGVDRKQMQVVVVDILSRRQHHAVLVVKDQGENFVLDNRRRGVIKDLNIREYRPIASINHEGSWIFAAPKPTAVSGLGKFQVAQKTDRTPPNRN